MIIAAIHWNVNPEIIPGFPIRYYGVLWAMAFYVGYIIFNKFVKREKLPEGFLDSLVVYTAVGTVIGARLGHCLFYGPWFDNYSNGILIEKGYLSHPLEIIKVWHGGLASHGAAIGILVAIYFFSKKFKKPFIYIMDRVVITVALGGAFIRLGNLMNSEIYGVETNLPWGFIFERNGEIFPKHPTQLYEALCYLLIFLILYYIYIKRDSKPKQGFIFGIFLILLFGARFLIEFVKNPQVDFESSLPINMGQILSIPFMLAGMVFIILSYTNKEQQAIVVEKKK